MASFQLFLAANASFFAGLAHRVDGGEACRYGHTDVAHTNVSTVAPCRPHYEGDTCTYPAPVPFVCACVDDKTAERAQDALGEARFMFTMVGLGCACTSLFMLLLRTLVALHDYCRRRFWHGGLKYALQPQADGAGGKGGKGKGDAAEQAARRQIQQELDGLWQCALCTTFGAALVGGPLLLWYGVGNKPDGYWVGCGARIPIVYEVYARPEFVGGAG